MYGVNSAFWLMPLEGPWPPEIDIFEVLGKEPGTLYMTSHTDHRKPRAVGGTAKGNDLSREFHTYGLMWSPETLTFYLDGHVKFVTPTSPDQQQPMYILVSLGVGGMWPGTPGDPAFLATFEIDYVRAYSNAPGARPVPPRRAERDVFRDAAIRPQPDHCTRAR